ncbi:MAG: cation-transporting P-type ATPase, partial [Leifsonia sp.]
MEVLRVEKAELAKTELVSTAVAGAPSRRIVDAAALPAEQVLAGLDCARAGLSSEAAAARLAAVGPNALRTHKARAWAVLGRQLK